MVPSPWLPFKSFLNVECNDCASWLDICPDPGFPGSTPCALQSHLTSIQKVVGLYMAHLPTICPVCRRDHRQTGLSADETVGKLDEQSVNICQRNNDQSGNNFVQPTQCAHIAQLVWKMATCGSFEEFRERFGGPKSKVINKQKGERIVKALMEGHPDCQFRHYIKSKGFSRLICKQLCLENVLCVPMSDKEKVL